MTTTPTRRAEWRPAQTREQHEAAQVRDRRIVYGVICALIISTALGLTLGLLGYVP